MARVQEVIQCDGCLRTVVRIDGEGFLIFRERHDREWHETKVLLSDLAKLGRGLTIPLQRTYIKP